MSIWRYRREIEWSLVIFGYHVEKGLFMAISWCWDFLRRWNEMFMGRCPWIFMDLKLVYELKY